MPKKGGANVNNGGKINNLSNANLVAKNMMNVNDGIKNLTKNNNNLGGKKKLDKYTNIIIIVFVIVLLAVLGYFGYRYLMKKRIVGIKTKELIPFIHDGKKIARFSFGSIPVGTERNTYNYNFWVYINDYDYRSGEDKCLLYKGLNSSSVHNLDTNENPGVYLLKNTNTLRVLINLETRYNEKESCEYNDNEEEAEAEGEAAESNIVSASNNTLNNNLIINEKFAVQHSNKEKLGCDHCDVKHFPLQKWVSVNISITNNVLDLSIDGKLHKSCVLKGSPRVNDNDLLVCPEGGFNGFISNLKVSSKALSVEDIEKLYKKGPKLKPGILN